MTDKKNDIVEDVSEVEDIVDAVEDAKVDEISSDESETEDAVEDVIAEAAPEIAPVAEKRGGFVPMVLGGVIAAGLGYGVAQYVPLSTFGITSPQSEQQTAMQDQLAALADQLASLQNDVNDAPTVPDLTDEVAASQAAINSVQAELTAGLADVNAKITTLEKRPLAGGDASGAIQAYEAELTAMQDRITSIADDATAKIAAAEAKAAELEQSTSAVSNAAMARAALMRVETSVARGGAFDEAIANFAEMSGVEIPETLREASISGVATLSELQTTFPAVARDALAASRKENASGDAVGRVGAFLKTQVNARSLTPREGDDPDAVLSRVEAALQDGRLDVALDEIQGLPSTGQAALGDWVAAAQNRVDVVTALEAVALGEKG